MKSLTNKLVYDRNTVSTRKGSVRAQLKMKNARGKRNEASFLPSKNVCYKKDLDASLSSVGCERQIYFTCMFASNQIKNSLILEITVYKWQFLFVPLAPLCHK